MERPDVRPLLWPLSPTSQPPASQARPESPSVSWLQGESRWLVLYNGCWRGLRPPAQEAKRGSAEPGFAPCPACPGLRASPTDPGLEARGAGGDFVCL